MFDLSSAPRAALPSGEIPLEEQRGSLSNLIGILRRRRVLVIAIFAIFVAMVTLGTILAPKRYTTQVKFIAGNPGGEVNQGDAGADSSLPVLNALLVAGGVQSAETYAELFQETPVGAQVVSDLGLNVSPQRLLSAVTVRPITNTSILTLSTTWSSPEASAAISNDFAKVIVDRERQLVASQATQALAFLSTELPAAQQRLRDTSTALAAYEAQHKLMDVTSETQSVITTLATIDSRLQQAQIDRRQIAAQLASVRGQMSQLAPSINGSTSTSTNPAYQQLQTQLSQVEVQLDVARKQYTEKYPAVMALETQQRELQHELAVTPANIVSGSSTVPNPQYQQLAQQSELFQAQEAASVSQAATLQAQRNQLAPALARLPSEVAELAGLQRQAKSAENVVTALQQKADNASIAKSTALSDVTVTQAATAAGAGVAPSLLANMLIAIVLGCVLAVGGALIVEYFDVSIKNEEEAEMRLSLPNLGSIPEIQSKNGAISPWLRAVAIESFLQLVTGLKYSSVTPIRSIAITSPSQGDGKSTIAVNTAIALAELEPRALLIDGDLRRPSLHTKFSLQNEAGFSDVLVGRKELSDVTLRSPYPGLDIVPSGPPSPNPTKLLQSDRFDEIIRHALETYRYVVVDTAACSVNYDAAIIAGKLDAAVMVIAASATDIRAASSALRKLKRVSAKHIAGFVLNRVVAHRRAYDDYCLSESATSGHALMIET